MHTVRSSIKKNYNLCRMFSRVLKEFLHGYFVLTLNINIHVVFVMHLFKHKSYHNMRSAYNNLYEK